MRSSDRNLADQAFLQLQAPHITSTRTARLEWNIMMEVQVCSCWSISHVLQARCDADVAGRMQGKWGCLVTSVSMAIIIETVSN